MTPLLTVPDEALDALASDADDTFAIPGLRAGQYSKRALLLRAVLDRAAAVCPAACRASEVERSFGVLAEVQTLAPEVVTATLLHPQVGGWAAHTLRRLADQPDETDVITADLRHLGAIAASAAIRAGVDVEVTVPVRRGRVVLPMLGYADLGDAGHATSATLRRTAGVTTLSWGWTTTELSPDGDGPWRPIPEIAASCEGTSLTVLLDHVDPYRDAYELALAQDLPVDVLERWRRTLGDAWALLVRYHPSDARSIAVGLSSIVPLPPAVASGVSATSADAVGAAAVSLPLTGTELAVALVHELQHSKLSALLDLVPLHSGEDAALFYAPWRDDPRPIAGLLHGCYAHFSITAFWRGHRHVGGDDQAVAHFEFARWCEPTWRTTATLLDSGALTSPGRRFVATMRAVLDRWRAEPVPTASARAAELASLDHRVTWRLRNARPDEAAVRELVRTWRTDEPGFRPVAVRTTVVPGPFVPMDSTRTRLLRRGLGAPSDADPAAPQSSADQILMAGDHGAAAREYTDRIDADPSDISAWAGLALAHHVAEAPTGPLLTERPELVFAVHREARWTAEAPRADALAAHLAAVLDG